MSDDTYCRPAKILLSAYDPSITMLLSRAITDFGYEVLPATNADNAKPLLPDADVVLSDVSNGGYDLLSYVKENKPDTPFILMDGGHTAQDHVTGAIIIQKPFMPSQLEELLDRTVSEHLKPKKNG